MSIFYPESNIGNIEYKVSLKLFTNIKLIKYATQLKYRILEGEGYAIYIVGITDKGYIKGIDEPIESITEKIDKICEQINSRISLILLCKYDFKKFIILKVISNFDLDTLSIII
uniref:Schlafen AlbA-2 domain-containing protein n=1 Tax=viral metagenome TaxID=1070528 RepID=A0A6C0IVI6_9ZZZZ